MNQNFKLTEGLMPGTLDHLILPMISIDEYESKIDDRRVIVVGFFVNDLDPADDLSMFIDKSSSDILDTEVSPSPTPDGYYMVFVEITRDSNFTKIVIEMLGQVENLCSITDWEMKCLGQNDLLPVDVKNMEANLILDVNEIPNIPDEEEPETDKKSDNELTVDDASDNDEDELTVDDTSDKEDELEESKRFWEASVADKIRLSETDIDIIKFGQTYSYTLINEDVSGGVSLLENKNTSTLQALLGPAYNVWNMNEKLVVEFDGKYQVLSIND